MTASALLQRSAVDERQAFIEEVSNADLNDREVFARCVRVGLQLSGMTVREAGALLKTAPGTVSRWANGHSAPSRLMRGGVVQVFVRRVRKIAQQG